jgi:hypothetical protein
VPVSSSSVVPESSSSNVVVPESSSSESPVPPSHSSKPVVPEPSTSEFDSSELLDLNKTVVNKFTYTESEGPNVHNHTVVVYDDYTAENATDEEVINRYNVSSNHTK